MGEAVCNIPRQTYGEANQPQRRRLRRHGEMRFAMHPGKRTEERISCSGGNLPPWGLRIGGGVAGSAGFLRIRDGYGGLEGRRYGVGAMIWVKTGLISYTR